ncbi:hypothetical protein JCM10908_006845 [Rhodotorula pacifica]|uniref:uncharacterized protein n=1 Tax=Rhodotorula pacifica TaxID=1495444 RepID=UPI00317811F5
MLKRKVIEFDWVVEETATLVKKARKKEAYDAYMKDTSGIGFYLKPGGFDDATEVEYEIKVTPEHNHHILLAKVDGPRRVFEAKSTTGWGDREALNEESMRRIASSFTLRKFKHFETILDSAFSEASQMVELPIPVKVLSPSDRFLGDVDEFAPFRSSSPPAANLKPRRDSQDGEKRAGSDEDVVPPQGALSFERAKAQAVTPQREFRTINVPDCSYATLAAYLHQLYSNEVKYLKSVAFLLVKNASPTESNILAWVNRRADGKSYPCLPHAMYRLADCYMETDLKRRAKGAILQDITVESAPYEVFSQLSRDYPDFQDDVVEFIVANLDDVIATAGWKRAVDLVDEGKIPGGGSILHKILADSTKATS